MSTTQGGGFLPNLEPLSVEEQVPAADRSEQPRASDAEAEPTLPVEAETPASQRELRIYSHSSILYWWPVWAVGYLMAFLTYSHGNPAQNEAAEQAQTWIHPSNSLGVVFVLVLFLVILITNFSVRGLASGMVILGGAPAHRRTGLHRLVGRGLLLVQQPQNSPHPRGLFLVLHAHDADVGCHDVWSRSTPFLGSHSGTADPSLAFRCRFAELQHAGDGTGKASRRSVPTLAPRPRFRRPQDSDLGSHPRADRPVQRSLHWIQSGNHATTHRRGSRGVALNLSDGRSPLTGDSYRRSDSSGNLSARLSGYLIK